MKLVKQTMSKKLITVRAEDDLLSAYKLMFRNNISHLPVLGGDRKIIGILCAEDISLVYSQAKLQVRDFMDTALYLVSEAAPVSEVARSMIRFKVSAFLVQDSKERTLGIITIKDILRSIEEEDQVVSRWTQPARYVDFQSVS
jgi:homoserine O-acetyltransferase/O-succinyltransferase